MQGGLEPYSRPRTQFLPIRTDQGRKMACLSFLLYGTTLEATFMLNFS